MASTTSDVLDIENLTFPSDEEDFLIYLEVESYVLIGPVWMDPINTNILKLEIITRRE